VNPEDPDLPEEADIEPPGFRRRNSVWRPYEAVSAEKVLPKPGIGSVKGANF
jgi:hypothetical protein